MWDKILDNVELIDFLIVSLIPFGYKYLKQGLRWLTAQTDNKWDDMLVPKFLGVGELIVREVYQTYVAAIKEAKGDGKLTPQEQLEAKRKAIARFKEFFTAEQLAHLAGAAKIEDFLSMSVDGMVNDVKKRSKPTSVPTPTRV